MASDRRFAPTRLRLTGVSTGEMLKGVRYFAGGAQTHSMAMRSRSGTIRWVDSWHNFERLDKMSSFNLH